MKRIILPCILCLIVGVALGAVTKKKFPYASKYLNQEVKMTRLEFECARTHFKAAEKIAVKDRTNKHVCMYITQIVAKAGKDSVELTAEVEPAKGWEKKITRNNLGRACRETIAAWRDLLPNRKPFNRTAWKVVIQSNGRKLAVLIDGLGRNSFNSVLGT